jgi:hypothetical protein
MTNFNPIWRLKIDSVEYTNLILANLTITSGRTDIYTQAVAGYVKLNVINLDQTNLNFQINANVSVELQDTSGTFVPIFGGSITDINLAIAEIGNVGYSQSYTITALGALARLPKSLFIESLPSSRGRRSDLRHSKRSPISSMERSPGRANLGNL